MLVKRIKWRVGKSKTYSFITAGETEELRSGEIRKLAVDKIKIPSMTDLDLCPYVRHETVHVIAVGESEPKSVDEERFIEYALVAAFKDGMINKGDVIGIIKMTPVEMG